MRIHWKKTLFLASCFAAFAIPGSVTAASHALVMTIAFYERGVSPLPEVEFDTGLAIEIAGRMGVPRENITVRTDQQLTLSGMRAAMKSFFERVQPGDQAFIYYSGHGSRENNPKASTGCTESIVTLRGELLHDSEIEHWMRALAAKASQVVFMNDSCFSGGAVTRGLPTKGVRPKFHKAKGAKDCSQPVNVKSLFDRPEDLPGNALYLAASADSELSFTSPTGSVGTLAWRSCIERGNITGEQLRACAQVHVDQQRRTPRQSITLLGKHELAVAFGPAHAFSASSTVPAAPPRGPRGEPANPGSKPPPNVIR